MQRVEKERGRRPRTPSGSARHENQAPHAALLGHRDQLGDTLGNLTYRLAGRNFNPLMAMAADKTIAQVSSLSEPGSIDPEQVVTPGIFVDTIVEVPDPQQEEVLVRTGVVY